MLIPFNRSWRERVENGVITHKPLFEEFNIKPTGIIHIGASEGQEAEVYVQLGIKRMIWIEAIEEVYDKLVDHVCNVQNRNPPKPLFLFLHTGQLKTKHIITQHFEAASNR